MRVLHDHYEVGLAPAEWDRRAPTVFQTWDWQTTWWATFGRGELVVVADQGGDVILPLFCVDGMLYPVGAGNSDYLDALWTAPPTSARLGRALEAALDATGAEGIRWYLLRTDSPTARVLPQAVAALGLRWVDEDQIAAPALSRLDPAALERKSLRRPRRWFEAHGGLASEQLMGADLRAALPDFFDQHVRRWSGSGITSPFEGEVERRFYEALADTAAPWLRMTRMLWDGRVIAQHVGMTFRSRYLWYKPTFDIDVARHSPGTALLEHLIGEALAEGCDVFDFGIGSEAFKDRYADQEVAVHTVGMYR